MFHRTLRCCPPGSVGEWTCGGLRLRLWVASWACPDGIDVLPEICYRDGVANRRATRAEDLEPTAHNATYKSEDRTVAVACVRPCVCAGVPTHHEAPAAPRQYVALPSGAERNVASKKPALHRSAPRSLRERAGCRSGPRARSRWRQPHDGAAPKRRPTRRVSAGDRATKRVPVPRRRTCTLPRGLSPSGLPRNNDKAPCVGGSRESVH